MASQRQYLSLSMTPSWLNVESTRYFVHVLKNILLFFLLSCSKHFLWSENIHFQFQHCRFCLHFYEWIIYNIIIARCLVRVNVNGFSLLFCKFLTCFIFSRTYCLYSRYTAHGRSFWQVLVLKRRSHKYSKWIFSQNSRCTLILLQDEEVL